MTIGEAVFGSILVLAMMGYAAWLNRPGNEENNSEYVRRLRSAVDGYTDLDNAEWKSESRVEIHIHPDQPVSIAPLVTPPPKDKA